MYSADSIFQPGIGAGNSVASTRLPSATAGQSALWKYKAIYRQGDDRVGQWSDVVSILVAG